MPVELRFIGQSTWMSRIGSQPELPGNAPLDHDQDLADHVLGLIRANEVEIAPGWDSHSGIWPWLMRWALTMIRLPAAWRNTSVSRTTGTMPLSIRSPEHLPGAHRGQLIDVADQQQAARAGTARSRWCMSGTSTIEVSSTTSRSQSRAAFVPGEAAASGWTSSRR